MILPRRQPIAVPPISKFNYKYLDDLFIFKIIPSLVLEHLMSLENYQLISRANDWIIGVLSFVQLLLAFFDCVRSTDHRFGESRVYSGVFHGLLKEDRIEGCVVTQKPSSPSRHEGMTSASNASLVIISHANSLLQQRRDLPIEERTKIRRH
jgi:hypothetical protein